MKTLTKDAVKSAVEALFRQTDKITTLDIKKLLRIQGYYATQEDVANFMYALEGELSLSYDFNGMYRTYYQCDTGTPVGMVGANFGSDGASDDDDIADDIRSVVDSAIAQDIITIKPGLGGLDKDAFYHGNLRIAVSKAGLLGYYAMYEGKFEALKKEVSEKLATAIYGNATVTHHTMPDTTTAPVVSTTAPTAKIDKVYLCFDKDDLSVGVKISAPTRDEARRLFKHLTGTDYFNCRAKLA